MENDQTSENSEPVKKTVLIFGISSFVGSNLAEFFKKYYRVIGTYYKTRVELPGIMTLPCDVLEKQEVQLVIFATKPDLTIYCIGISSIMGCSIRTHMAEALNTSGLFNVTENCQRYKSQICYLSSAFVFGGDKKNYLEMDIPDANTVYGKTQASAEFYLQKTSLNYIILRCCKLYGRGINPVKNTWFEHMQQKFHSNQSLNCDDYVQTGFLDVMYLGMIIKICLDKAVVNRLLQVSTQDTISHYQMAKLYAEIFNKALDLPAKVRWPFPVLSSKEGAVSGDELFYKMDISNVEGFLNLKLPTIRESLEFTFKRLKRGGSKVKGALKTEGIKYI